MDLRGLPTVVQLEARAAVGAGAGYTVGMAYPVVALGLDAATNHVWALVVDDAGALRALDSGGAGAGFTFAAPAFPPHPVAPA